MARRPARVIACACGVAREHALALGLHEPQPLVDLVHDRDGGRPRRLARGGRVPVALEVEVEARHPSPSRPRPTRAGPTAAIAMPGADIHAFWEPVTTRSRPHSSIANGTAPSAEIASTRISASGAASRTAAASAAMSLVTPVDVSLCVRRTALRPGIAAAASRTAAAVAASPHSTSSFVTAAPYTSAIFANRSPNAPMVTARTGSPGESVLTTAASRAPVPAHVSMMTSCCGAEERLHAAADPDEERLELLPAVVDHLAPAGLADGRRQGGGSGDPEVGLEAGHSAGLQGSREDAPDPAPRDTDPSTVVDMTSYEDRPDHDPPRRRPPGPPRPPCPPPADDEDLGDRRRARDVARLARGDAGVPVPRASVAASTDGCRSTDGRSREREAGRRPGDR